MSGLLLKLALTLIVVFAAALGLIRAQPHDDSALRAFLAPPSGCAAPCFMGIRPGVTTGAEAVDLLAAHPWVAALNRAYYHVADDYGMLKWTWSGLQPGWVQAAREGWIAVDRQMGDRRSVVSSVSIASTIGVGGVYLALGQPDYAWLEYDLSGSPAGFSMVYTSGFQFHALLRCPLPLAQLYRADIDIKVGLFPGGRDPRMGGITAFPTYRLTDLTRFPDC